MLIRVSILALALLAPHPLRAEESREACKNKFTQYAMGTGIVVSIESATHPVVWVNEHMWNQLDFQTKRGIAETFNCAVAGPGMAIEGILYKSNQSGKTLATWDGLDLIAE